jgi:hypothetical protein
LRSACFFSLRSRRRRLRSRARAASPAEPLSLLLLSSPTPARCGAAAAPAAQLPAPGRSASSANADGAAAPTAAPLKLLSRVQSPAAGSACDAEYGSVVSDTFRPCPVQARACACATRLL